jgi:hypothetical protein
MVLVGVAVAIAASLAWYVKLSLDRWVDATIATFPEILDIARQQAENESRDDVEAPPDHSVPSRPHRMAKSGNRSSDTIVNKM